MAHGKPGAPKGSKNAEGHGRPPKAKELALISVMDNIITQEEAGRILVDLMREGNVKAMELYLKYRYGTPRTQIDINQTGTINFNITDVVKAVGFRALDEDVIDAEFKEVD